MHKFLYTFFLFAFLLLSSVNAQDATSISSDEKKNPLLDSKVTFIIADDIKQLFDESEQLTKAKVTTISNKDKVYNAAENYLIQYAFGLVYLQENDIRQAEQAFVNAIRYEKNIRNSQLATSLFYPLYLSQANLYEQKGEFKKAYDQRRIYFRRYRQANSQENKQQVEQLRDKYQTEIKKNNNELLKKQNSLKQLQVEEIEQGKRQQGYIIIAVVIAIIVFILLIYRQIQVRKQLKKIAQTDALTGIANRKMLFNLGTKIIENNRQTAQPISILLFDLDNFKIVNEQFGHRVGDAVLAVVARLAKETVRSRDLLVRFGGEEFVAVLPDASIEQAKAMAERLREKIAQHRFSGQISAIQLSASIGIATLKEDMTLEQLIHHADIAMQQAKKSGHDQVVIFHGDMEGTSVNYRRNNE